MSKWRQPDWKVFLKPWRDGPPSHQGGVGAIEDYQNIRNIEWQSRAARDRLASQCNARLCADLPRLERGELLRRNETAACRARSG
jgi:hypothetical protein